MSESLSEETFSLLKKEFDFPENVAAFDEEKAIATLTKVIAYMLDRQFERLLQICYRIDLGEEKLKRILHESEPDHIASDLATALWNRQKQKVEIRKRYSANE
ncbi:hypothetical protein LV84_02876 [Algoriphagus ratkowskyi]|uniref:Uncharacterized protein n=1 Tax=Algoriphagus ratkowskyi TaxID=57028 RepID=A0A2W7SVF9_9BACT|nr:hypothetical protein [Algoriphagus ratkowskyi]PZX54722.1 hypothetical protein LV84_02876 [Algoriphagus ratkowskyi]TXD77030.1 hypothetical protein ESW18_14585 [Algoriphagus ratkowskyi]